jgi:hypothetical protein
MASEMASRVAPMMGRHFMGVKLGAKEEASSGGLVDGCC